MFVYANFFVTYSYVDETEQFLLEMPNPANKPMAFWIYCEAGMEFT